VTPETHHDVLTIGGGPAASAAATILAGHGHSVLILEREKFPRYHVGESLIPFTFQPLDRLGLIPLMRQSAFIKKYSVQFISPSGKASQPFYFFNRYDRETIAQTWQVLRSEFDTMLLDKARSNGTHVLEETTVTELLYDGPRVIGARAKDRLGRISNHYALMTLDCSGKESFVASRNRWRIKDPYLNKLAVWTYYLGAQREPGIDAGATTVAFVPQKGWFWYIPMHQDRVSVGVVAEPGYLTRDGIKDPAAIFNREIHNNAWIKNHLATGRQTGPYFVTSEFSFHSRHCGTEGLLLVGDAFCFLDPVFSSGLMLALKSGVLAADTLHAALLDGNLAPERFTPYATTLRQGIENMRKLVYAFYNPNFSFRLLTDKYPHLAGDVTDCLSGDLNKDYSDLWEAIREFAELPDVVPCGHPLVHGAQATAPAAFLTP
jgi:flavin-dependent dehydrogenase